MAELEQRLLDKISPEPTTGCWLWTGALYGTGYGSVWVGDGTRSAHIVVYEKLVGPVPDGFDLDHVKARGCATRTCVNPDHLEPVTRRVNLRRGAGFKQHLVDGEWWMICPRCGVDAPVATEWVMSGGYPHRHRPCHR